jgi:hypothetical protein
MGTVQPAMPLVRPATHADLDALVAGNLALAEETEDVLLNRSTLRDGVKAVLERRAPGQYWAAEQEGRVVGQLLNASRRAVWSAANAGAGEEVA